MAQNANLGRPSGDGSGVSDPLRCPSGVGRGGDYHRLLGRGAPMNTETVIYSQAYTHKGHEYLVWSYIYATKQGSTMLFAYRAEGATVEGLPARDNAVRQARHHIDSLPPDPVEETLAVDAPQAS